MPAETLRAPTPETGEFKALSPEPPGAVAARVRGRRPAPTRDQVWVALFLLALTGASLAIRTYAIHVHFWVDEGLSVGIASHPLSKIPGLLRQDGSPPLYYLLLHVWMSWFGHGEAATHAFSLVFALLAIPVAYWAGASIFDRKTGVIGALFAAVVPYLTTYAQETRMYSLVALLSLVVAASFVHTFV